MTRLWKWYENGIDENNVSKFVDEMKEVNRMELSNKPKRLPNDQRLHPGAITESAGMLLSAAAQNPQATDKVVSAALQMNIYLNKYYPTVESLTDEKMRIPAMLEVLKPHIDKYCQSEFLKKNAERVVKLSKAALNQEVDTMGRTKYSMLTEGYQTMLNGYKAMQSKTPSRAQSTIEI